MANSVLFATSVLFVCLGNICRSPTAEGVFRAQVEKAGLGDHILIDSAGTGAFHVGEAPDRRSTEVAARRGYDLKALRARQVTRDDFDRFDFILAMDHQNLANLQRLQPSAYGGHLGLFLSLGSDLPTEEVPDPYYGGAQGFEHVLDLIENAGEGLLSRIRARLEGS
ncbi:MAG: low molecular weight protein-tyrosine-phosphatase [Magnetovibrionaceae bacterium]